MELYSSLYSFFAKVLASKKSGQTGKVLTGNSSASSTTGTPHPALSTWHEASLKESEERFQTMANIAPVRIWLADHNGQRCFFNSSWLKFRGRTFEQEQGFGWIEGIDPGDLVHLMNAYLAAVRKREPYQLEYRILGADGRYHWLMENGAARISRQGELLGFIGSCVDISESKKTADLLSKSETRLHILDHIADGLNSGKPPADIIGETILRLSQDLPGLRILYSTVTSENHLLVQHCVGTEQLPSIKGQAMNLNDAPEYLEALTGPTPLVIMDIRRPGGELAHRNVPLASGARAILEMPVWLMGRICGILTFQCQEPRFWDSHEVSTVKEAASWIGLTLKHASIAQMLPVKLQT